MAEAVDAEGPEVGFGCSVVVEEREGWLAEDVVGGPDRAVRVDDVVEAVDGEVVDELFDGVDLVATGDADDEDVVAVGLVDLCDRRGFCLAGGSPGRPEPEDDVAPLEAVPVELPSAGEVHKLRVGSACWWIGLV
ncbi:MAG: hypothetical protein AAFN30_13975 [Actinomycetota bacterium]